MDSAGPSAQEAAELAARCELVRQEIAKRIIGQAQLIEHLLVTLLADGHALFVGVPGLAKTLLIQTLSEALDLRFNRIQFTPDLMPSDITGTEVLEQDPASGVRAFRFKPGPVFCNLLLADEINRTPPKTQAALLQSMQERTVTAGGVTHPLAPPFHVFATQNPIEQEGTYPLPEAQLDRFMMMLRVEYPPLAEELEVVRRTTEARAPALARVLAPQALLAAQDLVRHVPVADAVIAHAVALVRATRPGECPEACRPYLSYGAGPRAAQHLVQAAKARALLAGRYAVDVRDIRELAYPVLRHRLIRSYQAEAEGVSAEALLGRVLEAVRW